MLTAQAPLTLVIDGCNSRLRRQLCLPQTEINVESHFVGLLLRNCHMPISNHGLVCLADPTPAVIYPIDVKDGTIRALISCVVRVSPAQPH